MYTVSLLNLQKPRFGFISLWKEKQDYNNWISDEN